MRSSEDNGEGASNVLQDVKADVDGPMVTQPTPTESIPSSTESSTTTPASEPSAPPLPSELDVSVGDTAPFDYGKKLFNQLNELKTVYIESCTQLCNVYTKTSINDISVEDIKKCNKLQKKDLGDMLLTVLNKCSYLCFDANLESLTAFKFDTQFQDLSSELSKCIQDNLMKYSACQDSRLKNIEEQVNKLNSYTNFLRCSSAPPTHNEPAQPRSQNTYHHESTPTNVEINNPTLHIEESINNFITEELSTRVTEFLDECDQFGDNSESGHSVTMFGYPYHYNGSRHSNQQTEIPSPIKDVLEAINQKYPDEELNSCLVNKYVGPQSYLPRHADNEPTIAPSSIICTVSLGHSCTVKFSETHGQESRDHIADPNSLYVMSRSSQGYWQHQINSNPELTENSVRYSLTFRNVDKKFLKSTIIVGDSNTRNLKFGSGKGTFGHNMPGKREEAIHVKDIKPSSCCGYKNIFVHCGINDLKHHRVNNQDKIKQNFNQLKCKLEEILILCPTSKLFVSPILPTKSKDWNRRAVCFNQMLFDFCNDSNGKFVALNFSEFCDEHGNLRNDMGKFWNPSDPLHLGSRGISTLVKTIRQGVFSSNVTSVSYSDTLSGHSVSNTSSSHVAAHSGHPQFAPS